MRVHIRGPDVVNEAAPSLDRLPVSAVDRSREGAGGFGASDLQAIDQDKQYEAFGESTGERFISGVAGYIAGAPLATSVVRPPYPGPPSGLVRDVAAQ